MAARNASGVPRHAFCESLPIDDIRKGARTVAELSTKKRDDLRKNQFAYIDRDGGEHLPIHDESHIRNAMARFNQTEFQSKSAKEAARKKIVAAAKRHGIEIGDDSDVAHPAR
jgi:hypothetical protein